MHKKYSDTYNISVVCIKITEAGKETYNELL